MSKTTNLKRDQRGFASIVIALVVITVLALLTVGFAQLARREQQNALDKQLANQAYYAAESGVNDILQVVRRAYNNQGNPTVIPSLNDLSNVLPNTCLEAQTATLPWNNATNLPDNNINSSLGTSYSCVLLNVNPPKLVKSPIDPDTAWNISFTTSTGLLSSFTVSWSSDDNQPPRNDPNHHFTPVNTWGSAAVLRLSITPLANLDRASLINNTFNAFLYPNCSGGSTTYNPGLSQAPVVDASCSNNTYSVTTNGLLSSPGNPVGKYYLVSIYDYYDKSYISLNNATDVGPTNFKDGQAEIDVTGKAQNVLKRIQVYAPLKQTLPVPSGLEGQNICKRLDTAPIVPNVNPNGTTYESAGVGGSPDPCSFGGILSPNSN